MAYTPTVWTDGVTPVNATNLNKLEQGLAAAVGIPADVVVTPGSSLLIRNRFSAGDTQPAFKLQADGRIDWGVGGSTAPDTNLYRLAAAVLQTDGQFLALKTIQSQDPSVGFHYHPATPGNIFYSSVAAEANARFRADSNGVIQWGPGGATVTDTFLYRSNPGELTTDGGFVAKGVGPGVGLYYRPATAAGYPIASKIGAEPNSRFLIDFNGTLMWAAGATNVDVNLYRGGVNYLKTDYSMIVTGHLKLISDWSTLYFGAAEDAVLQRSAPGVLQTGALRVTSLTGYASGSGSVFLQTTSQPADGSGYLLISQFTGDTGWRYLLSGSGYTQWGNGAGVIDCSLYRSGAAEMTMGNNLVIGQSLYASKHVVVNNGNLGGQLIFGSPADVNLYRASTGVLKTDGTIEAVGNVKASGNVLIGDLGGGLNGGLLMGGDASLFRSAAGVVKTNGTLHVGVGVKFPDNTVQTTAAGGAVASPYFTAISAIGTVRTLNWGYQWTGQAAYLPWQAVKAAGMRWEVRIWGEHWSDRANVYGNIRLNADFISGAGAAIGGTVTIYTSAVTTTTTPVLRDSGWIRFDPPSTWDAYATMRLAVYTQADDTGQQTWSMLTVLARQVP